MDIYLIAGVGRSGQIGWQWQLPWCDPDDLRWFQEMTLGTSVVFGAATLATAPHLRRLKQRTVYEDDRNREPRELYQAWCPDGQPLWVAGGAKTYARWLPVVKRVFLGLIDYNGPGDVTMPDLWRKL